MNLMLYLAHRCQEADYFGSTKLCKLLYYSDFTAFARTGSPITGRITFDSRMVQCCASSMANAMG